MNTAEMMDDNHERAYANVLAKIKAKDLRRQEITPAVVGLRLMSMGVDPKSMKTSTMIIAMTINYN